MTVRSRKILTRLAVAVLAILSGAMLLEGATRLIYDRNGMHYGIEMWKYAKQLKRPSANPSMGHEHRPNVSARLMGVDVSINSLGLRGPEYSAAKPAGTYRILVLGDSMTLGWGVAVEEVFCTLLQQRLNEELSPRTGVKYEVVNAGVGNYNTTQELAYLEDHGFQLNPDLVVLGYYINDAEPVPGDDASFLVRHSYLYVLASSGLDAWARRGGSRPGYEAYYRNLYRDDAPGWQQCQASLKRLATACRERQVPLIVALLPELHQVGTAYPFGDIHDTIRKLCEAQEVATLDLRNTFAMQSSPSLWVSAGDAHPNAKAHRLIAGALYEALAQEVGSAPES